jgi:acetyl-CoA carboxylase biotin carboxyl carrier protein
MRVGIAELEYSEEENRVRIRRTSIGSGLWVSPRWRFNTAASVIARDIPSAPPACRQSRHRLVPDNELLIKSPIVAPSTKASSPGNPPFVRVGETVQTGAVLCIIESMKLMNEIEAEIAGVVTSKLGRQRAAGLSIGEALFGIRPL